MLHRASVYLSTVDVCASEGPKITSGIIQVPATFLLERVSHWPGAGPSEPQALSLAP